MEKCEIYGGYCLENGCALRSLLSDQLEHGGLDKVRKFVLIDNIKEIAEGIHRNNAKCGDLINLYPDLNQAENQLLNESSK